MTTVNYLEAQFDIANVAQAISVYADEARAEASLVLSTGIAGSDARITDSGEGSTGVLRWLGYNENAITTDTKPSPAAIGSSPLNEFLSVDHYSERYIKNVDSVGAKENSIQSLLSKVDGLSFLGRQFGAVRARREDANLRAILRAVGAQNLGTQAPTNGVFSKDAGKAVDAANNFGAVTAFERTGADTVGAWEALFSNTNNDNTRSSFFDNLLDAMNVVSGEFEEPFYYLVIDSSTYNTLRKQNVLDINPVQDGNLVVNTLLGGKIRLIVTGNAGITTANYSNVMIAADTAGTGEQHTGLFVTYLVKPSALHYSNVAMNNPTAIDTNPLTNRGFGDVSIVSRWGNIMHPRGYSWKGAATIFFPTDEQLADSATNWDTAASNVNQTGIFPIYHGA